MKGKRYVAGGVVVAGLFTTVVVHGAVTQLTAQAMLGGGGFGPGPAGMPAGPGGPGMPVQPGGAVQPGQVNQPVMPGQSPVSGGSATPGDSGQQVETGKPMQPGQSPGATPARPAAPGKPVAKPQQPKPTAAPVKPAPQKPAPQKPAPQKPAPQKPVQPEPGKKYTQFVGQEVNTAYGPVQVLIATDGAKLVGLRPVKAPQANEQQKQASIAAIKPMNAQLLASNGQSVQLVSGATATSQAYLQSFQSAMSQAGLKA